MRSQEQIIHELFDVLNDADDDMVRCTREKEKSFAVLCRVPFTDMELSLALSGAPGMCTLLAPFVNGIHQVPNGFDLARQCHRQAIRTLKIS